MPELESDVLPPLYSEPESNGAGESEAVYAPYGLKADGTPAKKRGRKPGSGGGSSGSRNVGDSTFSKRIADELVELSAPLGVASPMAMVHVEKRADKTAVALVSISKKYPRVKAALNSYFNSVAYKDIVLFVTGIPVAVMMDYGMIPHQSKMGIPWGMEAIWQECYGEEGSENQAGTQAEARGLASVI